MGIRTRAQTDTLIDRLSTWKVESGEGGKIERSVAQTDLYVRPKWQAETRKVDVRRQGVDHRVRIEHGPIERKFLDFLEIAVLIVGPSAEVTWIQALFDATSDSVHSDAVT